MTKSRKQKQKKKDFLKKKLKVGKASAKPSNLTDTSFVAKSINVKNQHLGDNEHNSLFKRLALLKHHNDTVRKETLQLYIKNMPEIINTNLMTPLLKQCVPMICDDDKFTRDALLEFLDCVGGLNPQILQLHCNFFILYITMSMTHIIPRIKADSTKYLICVLKYCSDEIVRNSWIKLMNGVLNVLGWGELGANTSSGVLQTKKRDALNIKIHLDALYQLIKYGCFSKAQLDANGKDGSDDGKNVAPHMNIQDKYLSPEMPQPYLHLRLFAKSIKKSTNDSDIQDTNSLANQDMETRQRVFVEKFKATILKETALLIQDGGECGKSANTLKQLVVGVNV